MNKRIVYFIITVCLTATVIWLLYNSFNRPKIKLETAVKSSIESPDLIIYLINRKILLQVKSLIIFVRGSWHLRQNYQ